MDGQLPAAIRSVLLLVEGDQKDIVARKIAEARPDLGLPSIDEARDGPDLAIVSFEPPKSIERFSSASWVHCAGAGVDKLLSAMPFTPPLLTRTVGRMGEQIAEWAIAYILEDLQDMHTRRLLQRKRRFEPWKALPRGFLFDEEVLIFGTGEIATAVAKALTALGAKVDGVSLSGRPKPPFRQVFAIGDIDPVPFEPYGVAISLLPATPKTKGMLHKGILCAFDGALFLSAGRGEPVDEIGVLRGLQCKALRAAVLDVFEEEPLKRDWFMWDHPRVTVTPHVSGVTRAEDIAADFLACLDAIERGEPPALAVDPERGY